MPFTIIRQDITKMDVDAIVNAANTDLAMGGGVCGAIFNAAGASELQSACDKAAPIKTGETAITPGFALPSKFIIHAAGPIYNHWNSKRSEQLLYSTYKQSLILAKRNECKSIAFPLISSGIYGYPKDKALKTATSAIRDFLSENDMDVYLVVFDRDAVTVSKKLLGSIKTYIDEHYIKEHTVCRDAYDDISLSASKAYARNLQSSFEPKEPEPPIRIDDLVKQLDEPFGKTLLRLIDEKGMTDVEVYTRANIDRRLFSKIRIGKSYTPGKRTILALAVSLELTLDETDDLLERAGYALSHSSKFDIIVEYFIINTKYDIFEINEVLFKYDQPTLG